MAECNINNDNNNDTKKMWDVRSQELSNYVNSCSRKLLTDPLWHSNHTLTGVIGYLGTERDRSPRYVENHDIKYECE